jgi:hypothetical protein
LDRTLDPPPFTAAAKSLGEKVPASFAAPPLADAFSIWTNLA